MDAGGVGEGKSRRGREKEDTVDTATQLVGKEAIGWRGEGSKGAATLFGTWQCKY